MQQLTFIVGTGRSGSTALSRMLNRHPGILSLNEYLASLIEPERALPEGEIGGEAFWALLSEPNRIFDNLIRSGAPLPEFLYLRAPGRFSAETTGIPALSLMALPHLSGEPDALLDELAPVVRAWPVRPAARQHEALFALLRDRFGRRVVVERSGYSLHWVPALRAAFPEARFVHLHRDGPDCALSMSRHVGFRFLFLLREILARAGVDRVAELTERHVTELPPRLAGLLRERFDPALLRNPRLPVAGFGALWSELITTGVALLDTVPAQRLLTLSYEELLDHPGRELARLARHVGADPLPEWLDAGRRMLDPSRRRASLRLPPPELAALRAACAPGQRALAGA